MQKKINIFFKNRIKDHPKPYLFKVTDFLIYNGDIIKMHIEKIGAFFMKMKI